MQKRVDGIVDAFRLGCRASGRELQIPRFARDDSDGAGMTVMER
jgi:hypothetical protein